jgi:hypothetical protein
MTMGSFGEDLEGGELALIVVGVAIVAYVIYKIVGLFNSGSSSTPLGAAGGTVAAVLNAAQTGVDTLTGGSSTSTPGSNSNLFYTGLSNFFSTGSLSGDTSSQ